MVGLKSWSLLFIIALAIVMPFSSGYEWPFMGSCALKDEKCQRSCVEKFFELYANGIPELDIPSMNPLDLGNITINGDGSDNFNINIQMSDFRLYNFTTLKCVGLKGFREDASQPMNITFNVRMPHLVAKSHVHLNGKILIFNVQGEADFEVHMKNISTTVLVEMESFTKDNQKYLHAKTYTQKQNMDRMQVVIKNSTLFKGDQLFSDVFANTINENWFVLRDEVLPRMEKANAKVVSNMMNKVLATMPYDRFFRN